jgi:Mn2+/Fe2+ NRAMP family transporter
MFLIILGIVTFFFASFVLTHFLNKVKVMMKNNERDLLTILAILVASATLSLNIKAALVSISPFFPYSSSYLPINVSIFYKVSISY